MYHKELFFFDYFLKLLLKLGGQEMEALMPLFAVLKL